MSTLAISDVYQRSRAVVWVEDGLTREVLSIVWSDPEITILAGAGNDSVTTLTNAGLRDGHTNVFGVIDRDFGADNQSRWREKETRIFRLPVHETENLLLDFECLARVSGSAQGADIQEQAERFADVLLHWHACKATLTAIRREVQTGFPRDPSRERIVDAGSAETYIRGAQFWSDTPQALGRWAAGTAIPDKLAAEIARLEGDRRGDGWLTTFSGKEILRHLRSHIRGLDRAKKGASEPARDLDLAKSVAEEMTNAGRVPRWVAELRDVLRHRVGLT